MELKKTLRLAVSASLAVATAASALLFAQKGQGTPSKYTEADLIWKDDFNGSKLNKDDWNYETHKPGWVNSELQAYVTSEENTYLKDGYLVIQPVRKEDKNGNVSYTSGRINTYGKHIPTYGRIEARLKVPSGKGFLPAFWMMPQNEGRYGQWPKCGEIDIMEVLGNKTDTLYGTLHFGEPHTQVQKAYTPGKVDFSKEFHVFAVEWEPGEIRFYCDGVNYQTAKDWFTKRRGAKEESYPYPAPYNQPFYIIFNVAVGGTWPGNPDKSTKFGENAQMVVDYVKIYQKPSYDENVKRPEKAPVKTVVDCIGNIARSGSGAWEFLKAQGGDGSINVDGNKLDIIPTKDGFVEYSVQVVQPALPMENGRKYRISFDAYADKSRKMIVAISGPDRNWVRYFKDTKVSLGKKKKHYSWEFTMTDESDANARIEFNCGAQGSTAAIHITNVRLEFVDK